MVKKALRAGVIDVKVIRGVEVGSYQYLVPIKLNLNLRKQRKPVEPTKQKLRLNWVKEIEVRKKFHRELDIRLRKETCKRELRRHGQVSETPSRMWQKKWYAEAGREGREM